MQALHRCSVQSDAHAVTFCGYRIAFPEKLIPRFPGKPVRLRPFHNTHFHGAFVLHRSFFRNACVFCLRVFSWFRFSRLQNIPRLQCTTLESSKAALYIRRSASHDGRDIDSSGYRQIGAASILRHPHRKPLSAADRNPYVSFCGHVIEPCLHVRSRQNDHAVSIENCGHSHQCHFQYGSMFRIPDNPVCSQKAVHIHCTCSPDAIFHISVSSLILNGSQNPGHFHHYFHCGSSLSEACSLPFAVSFPSVSLLLTDYFCVIGTFPDILFDVPILLLRNRKKTNIFSRAA